MRQPGRVFQSHFAECAAVGWVAKSKWPILIE
jgi:hypothetical protein